MRRILTYIYLPLAVLYLLISVVYPTDPQTIMRRHLTLAEARFMALSVAFSFIIIWLFAFYGSWRLRDYSRSIRQYRDGAAFVMMAKGMQILALYLPVRSVLKIALNYLAYRYPSLTPLSNLIITYVSLTIPLLAYVAISQSARSLFMLTKAKMSLNSMYVLSICFIVIAVTFSYATYSIANKLTPSDWLITTNYDIPVLLRILTIVVPYLFMWFIGLLAAYEVYLYQKLIKGIFYRESLKLLSAGIALEIVTSIFVQFITSISVSLTRLPLVAILAIVYSALILIAVAFMMIAKGVQRIRRLDEV